MPDYENVQFDPDRSNRYSFQRSVSEPKPASIVGVTTSQAPKTHSQSLHKFVTRTIFLEIIFYYYSLFFSGCLLLRFASFSKPSDCDRTAVVDPWQTAEGGLPVSVASPPPTVTTSTADVAQLQPQASGVTTIGAPTTTTIATTATKDEKFAPIAKLESLDELDLVRPV